MSDAPRAALPTFPTTVCDNSEFRFEAFDVFRLFLNKTHRNKERESGILMSCLLETDIQLFLDVLPERVAVGTYHHAAAHGGIICHLCLTDDLRIPFCVVFTTGNYFIKHLFSFADLNQLSVKATMPGRDLPSKNSNEGTASG